MSAAGALFFAAGVLLMLDRGLMAVGNLMFLIGVISLIGPGSSIAFFSRRDRAASSVCLFGGIAMVLLKWPFLGLIVEAFGIFNLFGPFLPTVYRFVSGLVSYALASR
ncbi:Golgi Transport [Geranomyces variabilis]|nr:Golgi Transport [Geranomyces variabilis]